MKTLCIDAGSIESGYIFLEGEPGQRPRIMREDVPCVDRLTPAFGKVENWMLRDTIIPGAMVDMVVFEFPYPRGMPTSYDEFLMIEWVGRLRAVAESAGVVTAKIFRMREKVAVCGVANATDSNIRAALIDIYGAPGKKATPGGTYGITKDMWSALAVGHTFFIEGDSEVRAGRAV